MMIPSTTSDETSKRSSHNERSFQIQYCPFSLILSNLERTKQILQQISGLIHKDYNRASFSTESVSTTENIELRFGRWTKAEKEKFKFAVSMVGRSRHSAISKIVKTRTPIQVKSFSQNYYRTK